MLLTNDDPNPPHIGNLPSGDLISLYYVLWIILVQTDFVLLPILPHRAIRLHLFDRYAKRSVDNHVVCIWRTQYPKRSEW